MANYKSNIMETQTGSLAAKLRPTDFGGRVRVVHGYIIPDSAYAAGSVLELARLPKGARILPISQIHFEAGQNASMTIKVGDSADNGRYLAAKAPGAAAASVPLDENRVGDYLLPEEDVIMATTDGAALAAGKKIYFDLFYVID